MKVNKRQTSMLFELISASRPLSYEYFENYFEVTKRTIREDIKCLNDLLSQDYHIQIQYHRHRGFVLEYDRLDRLEVLKNKLDMRFSDTWEIEDSMEDYYYRILGYFFTCQGYGRLDELSNILNVNQRSTSNLLKETRRKISRYHLSIQVRPHYGMELCGREIHLRYCIMDIIYRYSGELKNSDIEEGLKIFKLRLENRQKLLDICLEYIKEANIELSQAAVQKLIILIMVSRYRSTNGHSVSLKEEELNLFSKLSSMVRIDILAEKLEKRLGRKPPEEEILFFGIYVLTHLESYSQNPLIKEMASPALEQLLNYLNKYGICSEGASYNSWYTGLSHVIKQIALINAFDIFERSPNTSMKKAAKNTPLSSVIGAISHEYLENYYNKKMGENTFVNLSLAVYSCIRSTHNIRRRNSIAVLTPLDKRYGESLKRRVLDRYSNIIRNIEVISYSDLNENRLSSFDTLLYCGSLEAKELELSIYKLKVDYFFTEDDVRSFYEKIVVPSRIYKNSFGSMYREDYQEDYLFTTMDDLIEKEIKPFCSEEVLSQMNDFVVDEYSVFNRTLNIILFASKKEDTFSKLLFLRNTAQVNHTKFVRVFIHSIFLEGDLIKLKTAEKVIRNLTAFIETENDILYQRKISFYDFYINNTAVPLKSKKELQDS